MQTIKNIDGLQFWDLLILWVREHRISWWKKKIYEKVKCKCWKEYFTRREHIMWWRINNCWCDKVDRFRALWKSNKTHWMDGTRIYRIYSWIKQRCENKNTKQYHNYGWRGIKCKWATFEDFYIDMWESYNKHYVENNWDTTIDRIDVNWSYSKENCRWATDKEQHNNTRYNVFITYKSETKTLAQWEEIWFWKRIIWDRMKRGWDFEKSLLTEPWVINNRKSVIQKTLNWEFIKEWESMRQIEKVLWFSHSVIWKCCKWIMKKAYGYTWQLKL